LHSGSSFVFQWDMRILFVCTGNICRSPTAEAVLRHQLNRNRQDNIQVDSAATHAYHTGAAPDSRTIAMAARHGVVMDDLRARTVHNQDFDRFDIILAMAAEHHDWLQRRKPADAVTSIALFTAYAGLDGHPDIEDPYYGDEALFERVYKRIETGCSLLLPALQKIP
jgi:protein-tyrosine phosphatase